VNSLAQQDAVLEGGVEALHSQHLRRWHRLQHIRTLSLSSS